jgi:hypothetical protein
MIPALVTLPTTVLDDGSVGLLARCVVALGGARTVVVGAQRTDGGTSLDEFVVATAVAELAPDASVGIATQVAAGRAASVIAREATTAELLGACEVVVLEGDAAACSDAAVIVSALFTRGQHTIARGLEYVDGARNLPQPRRDGGPGIVWRDGGDLITLLDGTLARCGSVVTVVAGETMPPPVAGTLVELLCPVAPVGDLVETLSA